MSEVIRISASATDLLPVSVKLLFEAPSPESMPRAIPMRSQARKTQTATTLTSNQIRRQNGCLRLCQASQFANNKMCRASS